MAIIILKALLALSLFAMLFFIIFYLGYKCAWNQGWDEGWDHGWDQGWGYCTKHKCKGCVCYSFTANAVQDYFDEEFKDHDHHPLDYTEFDKYMHLVGEQVDKLKKEIEDDDL